MTDLDLITLTAAVLNVGNPHLIGTDAVRLALDLRSEARKQLGEAATPEKVQWLSAFCTRCGHDYGIAGWSQCPQCEPAF